MTYQLLVVVDTIATVLDVVAIVTRFFAEKSLRLSTEKNKNLFSAFDFSVNSGKGERIQFTNVKSIHWSYS